MQYNVKVFNNTRLTCEQQTNVFLYNNKNAYHNSSELDLIQLSLFEGAVWSDRQKRQYYKKEDYHKRHWWDQQLIQFNKPGWWNTITGWERGGLYQVIAKHGPFFFKWKYLIKSRRLRLFVGSLSLRQKQKTSTVKEYQWHKKLVNTTLSLKFNKQAFVSSVSTKGGNRLIQLSNYFYSTKYAPKSTLTPQLNHYTFNVNLKSQAGAKFKTNFFLIRFSKFLRQRWLQDNTHYLTTVDIRITALTQPYPKLNAGLLNRFYAQQMSLIAARRTQRWFLRDIKKFNYWFWQLSQVKVTTYLQLSTFYAIHTNTKGRIADARRVFSRQHTYGLPALPKSKYLTHPKATPSYAQAYLTTKWGSTNLRTIYYNNYHYTLPYAVAAYQQRRAVNSQHNPLTFSNINTFNAQLVNEINYASQILNKKQKQRAQPSVKYSSHLRSVAVNRSVTRLYKGANRSSLQLINSYNVIKLKKVKRTYYKLRDLIQTRGIQPTIDVRLVDKGRLVERAVQTNPKLHHTFVKSLLYKLKKNTYRVGFAKWTPQHKQDRWHLSNYKANRFFNLNLISPMLGQLYKQHRAFNYKY